MKSAGILAPGPQSAAANEQPAAFQIERAKEQTAEERDAIRMPAGQGQEEAGGPVRLPEAQDEQQEGGEPQQRLEDLAGGRPLDPCQQLTVQDGTQGSRLRVGRRDELV